MTNSGPPAAKTTTLHLALLGGFARKGPWEVRRRTIAISPVGGIDLDLTETTLPDGGATIIKWSLAGGAKLRVPAGVNVVVEGFNVVGRRTNGAEPAVPGAPTIRLVSYGLFGGVEVQR